MKLKDIMTKEVEILHLDDTVRTAAEKMRFRDVGFLPVLEDGELIGVITDRDLVVRAMANGTASETMIGRDFITAPGIYCFEDQELDSAVNLMVMHQIRRLVILDRNDGSVVGVVSLGDLAVNISSDTSGEVLQEVSSGVEKVR
jgi:CBS domain-containing protein